MKRLVLAVVLVFAISLPSQSLARPAARPAARNTAASVLQRSWSKLLGFVRGCVRLPVHADDGGGHNLPPPSTTTTGG